MYTSPGHIARSSIRDAERTPPDVQPVDCEALLASPRTIDGAGMRVGIGTKQTGYKHDEPDWGGLNVLQAVSPDRTCRPSDLKEVVRRPPEGLIGRHTECRTLDQLIEAVHGGDSRSLVVRGEAGVGKSALLEHLARRASPDHVARARGFQSELELPFAALHQLFTPMLGHLDQIAEPQRNAIRTVLGLQVGPSPDPFLVAVATLSLCAEVADERPLFCLIDDAQWLDRASMQVLAFMARRTTAEPIGLVFSLREPHEEPELAGLPELHVAGLRHNDARALLDSMIRGPVDERVRNRIVAETRGNPLALVELPKQMTPLELAGGFGLTTTGALSSHIELGYARQLGALSPDVQRLLLVAAAEPIGDPLLVWRAADRLGLEVDAAALDAAAPLVDIGSTVRFRHPLVRSAIYRLAHPEDRRRAHGALAMATNGDSDPDRRAWHRAHATVHPDEDVATELEQVAGRAQAHGGFAAAGAFLERAADLTLDPAQRAERALAAAQAKHESGASDAATSLLAAVEGLPINGLHRARASLLRAQIGIAVDGGPDALAELLAAARRLEPLDVRRARETYLDALSAAAVVGRLGGGLGMQRVAEAARAAPPPTQPARAPDLLLDGVAAAITEDHAAAAPLVKRALRAFRQEDLTTHEGLRWLWLAAHSALVVWDYDAWEVLSARHVQLARDTGALAVLPRALNTRIAVHLSAGDLAAASVLLDEAEAIGEATHVDLPPYNRVTLAALRGREAEAVPLIERTMAGVLQRGEGIGLAVTHWATAVLCNALGRYEDALSAVREASDRPEDLWFAGWGSVELVEAAARSGDRERAAAALRRLSETTQTSGTDLALGMEARSRALLSEGSRAEMLYREAIARFEHTRVPLMTARAHLIYGEWLRRERRRMDARTELRAAREMFEAMGLDAFERRAASELLATGETARKRAVDTRDQLTAQEAQIARLARDQLSNPEIGSRLFISRRTVEYHLRKVYIKLGITSRNQLAQALPRDSDAT